ncbi:unnamed protein product [Rotaria sordida]|uniref:Uncharacterized protein n=1 Tax=Rotaria sordida TaxID=392033 RepID=A0A818VJQ4_9BILA|nr:unnamed protein product [Rotaria sordida]CAF3712717.1 unnamed protein product [Rotaria sordida]
MANMARRILLLLLILCICYKVINGKGQCSCSCCSGNRCIKRYQGAISMPTCSSKSCKQACKLRYPGQCGRSPGSLLASCAKTIKPRRLSLSKKMRVKHRPSSKKHLFRRTHRRPVTRTKIIRRKTYIRRRPVTRLRPSKKRLLRPSRIRPSSRTRIHRRPY